MADKSGDAPEPYGTYLREIVAKGLLQKEFPAVTTDPNLLEKQAKEKMTREGFAYIVGGAGEEATMVANRNAFQQWRIIPRMLNPTNPRDLSVTLFGEKYDTPVIMAPVGINSLYHPDKEIGTAGACAAMRVPYTFSTAASSTLEEVAEAVPDSPKFFQLYWPLDEEITASILHRAKAVGCKALIVTLDTWTLGWRPTDLDLANMPFVVGVGNAIGFSDPVFRRKFAERSGGETPESAVLQASMYWVSEAFPSVSHTWEDLKILKKYWDGPIILKGITSVDDARLAVEHGMDGIVVSNHGGRQFDGCVSTLEVLPEIAEAVGDKLTIMLDSGIRTGADIIKALALGAKAVLVGRPIVYGLGINGRAGAESVLHGLLADLDITMGLIGAKSIPDLKKQMLRKTPQSSL